jgi:hypothetical protein
MGSFQYRRLVTQAWNEIFSSGRIDARLGLAVSRFNWIPIRS